MGNCAPNQIVGYEESDGRQLRQYSGYPGCGRKAALKLLSPNILRWMRIYENVEQMPKNKLHEKMKENNKDSAYLSYQLATIVRDAPVKESLE